jgi:hypothetical protein
MVDLPVNVALGVLPVRSAGRVTRWMAVGAGADHEVVFGLGRSTAGEGDACVRACVRSEVAGLLLRGSSFVLRASCFRW